MFSWGGCFLRCVCDVMVWTAERATWCWWTSCHQMAAGTSFITRAGRWRGKPTRNCPSVCTFTRTAQPLENTGCPELWRSTSWNWPTTSQINMDLWVMNTPVVWFWVCVLVKLRTFSPCQSSPVFSSEKCELLCILCINSHILILLKPHDGISSPLLLWQLLHFYVWMFIITTTSCCFRFSQRHLPE